MNNRFLITTAIPYVNARPHLGFALEIVQADCLSRFCRLLENDVFFLTGTDENALKNVQAAQKEKVTTKELVDRNASAFFALKKILNLTFDDFIRTTEKRHIQGAQRLWLKTNKKDIYKKKYKGLYCVGCEQFYTKDELTNGKCPEHDEALEKVEEENYFFRLSNYQERLERLIVEDKLLIIPKVRKNEVLSFIRSGLNDFSISRSIVRAKGWGVPVPGDKSQIIYVWYDALANYITALGFAESDQSLFQKYWLDNPNRIHLIGKGIIRFHAVYWPAMLLSAGLPLPTVEYVHGYITVNGKKISKSLGNIVEPSTLVKEYGTDSVRYYLLREIPAYGDGDFSARRFQELYNADLANGLGNLIARVSRLTKQVDINTKHFNNIYHLSVIKHKKEFSVYFTFLEEFRFNDCLAFIWEKISSCDKFLDEHEPWKLKGRKKERIVEISIKKIMQIATLLEPFLPETSVKIKRQFSGGIHSQKPLFPRIK